MAVIDANNNQEAHEVLSQALQQRQSTATQPGEDCAMMAPDVRNDRLKSTTHD